MLCMASTKGTTLCCLMSRCWMGRSRSSFFVGMALLGYQLRIGLTRDLARFSQLSAGGINASKSGLKCWRRGDDEIPVGSDVGEVGCDGGGKFGKVLIIFRAYDVLLFASDFESNWSTVKQPFL